MEDTFDKQKEGGKKNKRTAERKEDRLVNWYLTPSRQRRLHQCGSSCSSKRIIRRRGKGTRSIKKKIIIKKRGRGLHISGILVSCQSHRLTPFLPNQYFCHQSTIRKLAHASGHNTVNSEQNCLKKKKKSTRFVALRGKIPLPLPPF